MITTILTGWAVLATGVAGVPAWCLYLRRSNRRSAGRLHAAFAMSKSLTRYPLTQDDLDWLKWAADGEGLGAEWARTLWASLRAWSPKGTPVAGQVIDLTSIVGGRS